MPEIEVEVERERERGEEKRIEFLFKPFLKFWRRRKRGQWNYIVQHGSLRNRVENPAKNAVEESDEFRAFRYHIVEDHPEKNLIFFLKHKKKVLFHRDFLGHFLN